jgi:hypothetical protein
VWVKQIKSCTRATVLVCPNEPVVNPWHSNARYFS